MKIIGILVIILGFFVYIGVTSFESSLPLVQFVDGEQIVSTPTHLILPPNTTFVKGTGERGARFVDIHSDATKYLPIARYLGWAKLGGLFICALGAIGLLFEHLREREKRNYELSQVKHEATVDPDRVEPR